LDPSIPKGLSDIVSKCLERDVNARYGNAQEILDDLDAWRGDRPVLASTVSIPAQAPKKVMPWKWIGAGLLAALVVAGGWLLRGKIPSQGGKTAVQGPVASLAILPFRNASGDPSLDWLGSSIAEMLSTDVGQSASLRTVSADRLHQILNDLHMTGNAQFDPATLRQISESSNADTLISGQYVKFGDQIRIDASLQDLKHDRRVPLKVNAAGEKDIPGAVDRLAESIRQNLAVSPDVIKELKSSSFQPTSKSVAALREYNQGIQNAREGKNLEALKSFQASTKDDPEFALAFSKLAETYNNLGYGNEADQYSRKAVELASNLPTVEKYLITASHAHIARDYQKAIESYENLAKVSPDNADVQLALAHSYEDANDFPNARQHYQKVLQLNPKDINALVAVGRVEIYSGNYQDSLEPLNRAQSLNIQVDNQEQRALILQLLGTAYASLSKPDEALRNYQQSLDIARRLGEKKGIADTLYMIGQAYVVMGKTDLAFKNQNDALHIYRDIGDKAATANTLLTIGQFYVDRGEHEEALKIFKEALLLERDVGDENYQAFCLHAIGNTYLSKGDYENARTYFAQALQLREKFKVPSDIANTLHNLAETDMMTARYDQALAEYLRALDLRRGANDKPGTAIEADSMGILFEYQGRYGAAVKSREEGVNILRQLKDRSYWMAYTLSGYGDALVQVGRFDDAAKAFNDAMDVARELKNQFLIAQISERQGISFLYRGDLKSAKPLLEKALQTASSTGDHNLILETRLGAIKLAQKQGQIQAITRDAKNLANDADAIGLKYLAVEASSYYAEGLLHGRDYSRAEQELVRALEQSDKLGLHMLSARNNFLYGELLRTTDKSTEAAGHYREAVRIIDEIRKEPGAETLLQRPDLQSMYTEASRWSQSAKN
jgi:tetratricopeptide (TPR) repeat protein